jgi:hypothetical protein
MGMTNQQILTKAIEQAVENGWSAEKYERHDQLGFEYIEPSFIFDHNFAKSFFDHDKTRPYPDNWKHHLQQMVVSEDPIKYLEGLLK